jgi:hypothetical protein
MAEIADDRDMFVALTTLECSDIDLHSAVEVVDVVDTMDTSSDEEMTDQSEATTPHLPGPKLQAADPRDTRAASVLHNSVDDNAVW